jgi:pyruvate/2-oxoglutarate dehydrogenase complex dihydrolipoamide dehydrogenase (E3) component
MEGYMPGKEVVILGSGDIGLIMARRMTLEGAKVKVVAEVLPFSGGLKRNIVQCLDDYGIPLELSTTVVDIKGKERVEGVTLAKVDENRRPIPGTEVFYTCDTLLLSVGLIPENELSRGMDVEINPRTNGPIVNESLETNIEGVFACGNVLHVHDLVDFVSAESSAAGRHAAEYARGEKQAICTDDQVVPVIAGNGVTYTVPSFICPLRMDDEQIIRFRVNNVYRNHFVTAYLGDERLIHRKRQVLAPGEMEDIKIKSEDFFKCSHDCKITVSVEVE